MSEVINENSLSAFNYLDDFGTFIRRRQSSGSNRSFLITLLAEVLVKMLSVVYNLNKASHILGLQLNS